MPNDLLISQLSKATGIPAHTIRYYEKFGLFRGKKIQRSNRIIIHGTMSRR